MIESEFHGWAVGIQFILAGFTALGLTCVVAPYGRHMRKGWGPTIPCAYGWLLMELPAVGLFALFFFTGNHRFELVPLLFLGLWQLHYLNRALIFPARIRSPDRRMPILIPTAGIVFNTLNAYVSARWIGHLGAYGGNWLADPRFLVGCSLFLAGWLGNLHSDTILRNLRKPGGPEYKIPNGGLFRWVSSPNYLCEIVEWSGWAIATWSTAGLAFAVYTAANLVPRAFAHHAWYRKQFDDYPSDRKVIFPLWI